jgi:hypothetical protein
MCQIARAAEAPKGFCTGYRTESDAFNGAAAIALQPQFHRHALSRQGKVACIGAVVVKRQRVNGAVIGTGAAGRLLSFANFGALPAGNGFEHGGQGLQLEMAGIMPVFAANMAALDAKAA